MKTKVVVCRKWNNPSIEAFVSNDEVGASMTLEDFVTALVEEVGNPTLLVSKAKLHEKLSTAASVIAGDMKITTKYL